MLQIEKWRRMLLFGVLLLPWVAMAAEQIKEVEVKWDRPPYQPIEILNKRGPPKDSWSFVAFGDPHIRPAEVADPTWNTILKLVEAQKPSLVLLLGDIAVGREGGAGNVESWKQFFAISQKTLDNAPWFFAIGSYDVKGMTPSVYDQIFKGPETTAERGYYAFDYGNTRFIHCLCGNDPSEPLMNKGLKEWLEAQFASFKGEHVILFNHCPPYTPTKYRYRAGKWLRDLEQSLYSKYLDKFTVTMISGHVHHYYRTCRSDANYFTICAGLGGNFGANRLMDKERQEVVAGDVSLAEEGVGVFTVEGQTIRYEYKDFNGKVLDKHTISKAR
ncbi:MAG: metallophosphoesterase [Planctomycetota bacterium]